MGLCVKADWIEDQETTHVSDRGHESRGAEAVSGETVDERRTLPASGYHLSYVYADGRRVAGLVDPEAVPTMCAARREAAAIARELAADALRSGRAVEDAAIEICDAEGGVLTVVSMQDAILGGSA